MTVSQPASTISEHREHWGFVHNVKALGVKQPEKLQVVNLEAFTVV
jgi:hypothetical protein